MKRLIKGKVVELVLGILLVVMTATGFATESVTYYHNDHLGSPVIATNSAGAVIWRESYQPYGQREIKQGDTQNSLWYTGKQEESAIGLSYYGARWYNPELGQFMSIDPVGVSPGSTYSFNRYAYANGNPYRFLDPDGRNPGDHFSSAEDAAIDMFSYIREKTFTSHEYNKFIEYGNWIVRGDHFYTYDEPVPGGPTSLNLPDRPDNYAGSFHTHTLRGFLPDSVSSDFSRPNNDDPRGDLSETNRSYYGQQWMGAMIDQPDGTQRPILRYNSGKDTKSKVIPLREPRKQRGKP